MYINTALNYTGSKFKLLEQIVPEFDYQKNNFFDLFTGGGSVFTNVLDKFENITINDIITDLVEIHKGLYNNTNIVDDMKMLCVDKTDKDGYNKLRDLYNLNNSPAMLWALLLCCTNNMLRFNNKFKFNQTFGQRSFNDNTEKKINILLEHYKKYPNKVEFISKSFNDILIRDNTFYYIDPPYSFIKNEDGTIGKKQISEAGYNCYWKQEDDIKLYEYLKMIDKIGSSFMVSGVLSHDSKTCWMLDKLIQDGYRYKVLEYDYNKVSRKGDKETTEIIIMNYVEKN
jgi:DNA adenine methylase Dam